MTHKLKVQLRFNDIDILGHLNNTVYFSLYDLGKAQYMEEAGLRDRGPAAPTSVIADVHCSYIKPIHYGDEIYVTTHCSHIGEKSFVLEQEMIDNMSELRSKCTTVMVYIDPETQHSTFLPPHFRDKIEAYEKAEDREE